MLDSHKVELRLGRLVSLDILHQKRVPGHLQRDKGFSKKEFRFCVDPCSESAAGKAALSHQLQRGSLTS